jgi:alpha,alpha-trehalase
MIARNAADYNGTVPEKYDVVKQTHQVFAEYGNVGTKFSYITREGFGWMNASVKLGLQHLPPDLLAKLRAMTPPEDVFGSR